MARVCLCAAFLCFRASWKQQPQWLPPGLPTQASRGDCNKREERGFSLGSPSLPQSWEAEILVRLDPGTGWCYTLWALPQAAWRREDTAHRGRGEQKRRKDSPFRASTYQPLGEKAKSQRQSAPGTPHPLSPVLKLSAGLSGPWFLLPARLPLRKPGAFPLPSRPHARSRICPINKASA